MVTFDINTTRQSKMTSRIIKSLENVDSKKYQEPKKKIPVLDECDILICGGGPAGGFAPSACKDKQLCLQACAGNIDTSKLNGNSNVWLPSLWGGHGCPEWRTIVPSLGTQETSVHAKAPVCSA